MVVAESEKFLVQLYQAITGKGPRMPFRSNVSFSWFWSRWSNPSLPCCLILLILPLRIVSFPCFSLFRSDSSSPTNIILPHHRADTYTLWAIYIRKFIHVEHTRIKTGLNNYWFLFISLVLTEEICFFRCAIAFVWTTIRGKCIKLIT